MNRGISGSGLPVLTAEQGISLDLSRFDCGEAKDAALVGPTERNSLVQIGELQRWRLVSVQDRVDDIRCEKREAEHVADIGRSEAGLLGQSVQLHRTTFK